MHADVDEYSAVDQVRVEVWVVGDGQNCDSATGKHSTAVINSDDSVTTKDNVDGQGVDVYNAGTNNQLQGSGITVYAGEPSWDLACIACGLCPAAELMLQVKPGTGSHNTLKLAACCQSIPCYACYGHTGQLHLVACSHAVSTAQSQCCTDICSASSAEAT